MRKIHPRPLYDIRTFLESRLLERIASQTKNGTHRLDGIINGRAQNVPISPLAMTEMMTHRGTVDLGQTRDLKSRQRVTGSESTIRVVYFWDRSLREYYISRIIVHGERGMKVFVF